MEDLDLDQLSEDVLEALLEYVPEYSWEDVEDPIKAPIPPMMVPPELFVRPVYADNHNGYTNAVTSHTTTTTISAFSASANGFYSDSHGSDRENHQHHHRTTGEGRGTVRATRRTVQHKTARRPINLYESRTFPFNYVLPFPPPFLLPLSTISGISPVPPKSSIIVSPYLRLPPYTFCLRTSQNWRTRNSALSLKNKCHQTYLPYFEEGQMEDEDEFRERIAEGKIKINFLIPNEESRDPPKPEPSDHICGVCLTVGCIAHHYNEAVPQPVPRSNGRSSQTMKTGLSTSSAVSDGSQGPPSSQTINRFARQRPKERSNPWCGNDCVLKPPGKNESIKLLAYSQWPEADKQEFKVILSFLSSSEDSTGSDSSINLSGISSCTVSGYMASRTCRDIDMALKDLPDIATRLDIEPAYKRRKTHASQDRSNISEVAHHQPANAQEADENFSAEEISNRVPRVTLPWAPCYHPGRPCSFYTGQETSSVPGEFCICKRNGTWCESGCGCPTDCSERHPGCDCIFRGKECRQAYVDAKTGNQTPGCPCADQARECVIGVCKGHQTDKGEELLSSGMGANASFGSNGHGGTWTENKRCRNMSVQNDKALRTFVAASDLEGYGLFVGEDYHLSRILIGEYRGELCNEHEAQMRSLLYQTRQRSFLFDLTKLGVIDGLRLGNKTRYMNTSRNAKNNCNGASTTVNGEAKLVVHANRDANNRKPLQKNDELLLDYGMNFELFED